MEGSPGRQARRREDGTVFVAWTYWIWTQGSISGTVTMALDPSRRYLVTGALTGKAGGDYGQVYISTVCVMYSSDQVLCGVRDDPSDPPDANIANLGIVEILQNATQVTVKLRGDGGLHRAEGVIYDIT
jgi:hypothetical protein